MKFYKMNKPAGKWTEITEDALLKVISAHFEENEQTSWDGQNKPSRSKVLEYIKTGNTLHLYTADYKAVLNTEA